jgi:cytochrome c oxidase subunit 4
MHDKPTSGHEHGHGDHGHHEHAPPKGIGKYVAVFLSLCVLTAISFGIANSPLMQTESIGWTGMMAVSCAKALLVIMFFMHLRWEANWKYVLTIPASIMSIFLLLMLVPDIGRRTRNYAEDRWLHAADPQSHQVHGGAEHDGAHDGNARHGKTDSDSHGKTGGHTHGKADGDEKSDTHKHPDADGGHK